MASDQPFELLRRKLQRSCELTAVELKALQSLPYNLRSYKANSDLMREGDRPSQSCYVVDGFLFSFKFVREGSRQIMAFHLPGDLPDLQSVFLARSDHYLGTLTATVVAFVPHDAMLELTLQHPRLGHRLWRDTLIDAAIFREWVVNIGRRSALGRIAHLLCEQALRLKQVGLGDEAGFPWFVTQANLADATGLSVVHVNRSLQSMRGSGLIGPNGTRLHIRDWDALAFAGDFTPDYLHLDERIGP